MIDFTQADRDEMRGTEWIKSLEPLKHAALAIAINGGQHIFQARCGCRWEGPVHKWDGQELLRIHGRLGLNTLLWMRAVSDADAHNFEMRNE